MKKLIKVATPLAAALLLSACSSTPDYDDIMEMEMERTEAQMEAKERRAQMEMKAMEKSLASMPDWVLNPPRIDETGIYGVGVSTDKDFQTAVRKSNLQARYDVAKEIRYEMSGEDTMSGAGGNQYRYIINGFVDSVDLTGVESVRREVVPDPDGYKVMTLVKMPLGEFNMVLNAYAEGMANAEPLQDAYSRLMDRVKESRDARLEEQQARISSQGR